MGCSLMGCSLIKKAVVGTALGAGALYLAFGTSAPSYVKTAFHNFRHTVKNQVPVQFDIDRAREEIKGLEPAIKDGIAEVAWARNEIKGLEREISTTRANLEAERTAMKTIRTSLDTGDYRLAGPVRYTEDEVKADLAHRLDSYKNSKRTLEDREATLKAKMKTLAAAESHLKQMAEAKKALSVKIEGIEARLRMIETTRADRDFHFDDSALARAKESVSDLEKRLDVLTLQAEMEGKYSDTGVPIGIEPGRDVVKELDAEFGPPAKKGEDKSL
jgi:DNA repair exonuclease SbcCD ATPase subunit